MFPNYCRGQENVDLYIYTHPSAFMAWCLISYAQGQPNLYLFINPISLARCLRHFRGECSHLAPVLFSSSQ
jgi:hypothetical protein